MRSFLIAQASPALLDPGLLLIVTVCFAYLAVTLIGQGWLARRPAPPTTAAIARRQALLAAVKARWAT